MAIKDKDQSGLGMPVTMMILLALAGAIVTSLCFIVVGYWPLPASIAPYFGWKGACAWGAISGGIMGLVLGYLMDDSHFERATGDK